MIIEDDLHGNLQNTISDTDVIVAGDYNTMGHKENVGLSSLQEIDECETALQNESPPFRLMNPDLNCSEYFDGNCSLLDHFGIPKTMIVNGEAKD